MDTEEDTMKCKHCHKEVTTSNIALHESHCVRFLCLCPDCDESVPRDQLEQHRQDQHSQVRCLKCKVKLEGCKLQDHESEECPERLKSCEFCELELPLRALTEHTMACGSRTELCADCGCYVTLKDYLHHAKVCSTQPTPDKTSPNNSQRDHGITKRDSLVLCWNCMRSIPADQQKEHERKCAPPLEERTTWDVGSSHTPGSGGLGVQGNWMSMPAPLRREGTGVQESGSGAADEISTCSNCHLALPLKTLQWHEGKCKIFENLKKRNKKEMEAMKSINECKS